jgi:hypothetical protein
MKKRIKKPGPKEQPKDRGGEKKLSFDLKKFETTNFNYREKEIDVPELKEFFNGKKKPKWKIRGLTGIELAEVRASVNKNKDIEKMVELISSEFSKDKIEAFKEAFGMNDQAPDDWVRRVTILIFGSVDPVVDRPLAVKFGEVFPVTFQTLTDQIQILTGQGKLGEFTASGQTQK